MPAKESEEREGELGVAPTSLSSRPCLATMFTLPADPSPSHYHIVAAFDIPAREFRCSVATKLTFEQPSATVFLNSQNLELSNVRLVEEKTERIVAGEVAEREDIVGVARIEMREEMPAGEYTLHLDCRGAIRTGLQGVYINKFVDEGNQEKDGVSTMFAATEARSFIPCWDQPNVKCSFSLTVAVGEELQVLSNMGGVKEENWQEVSSHVLPQESRSGWSLHCFPSTPRMSTYLLCLVVGQYSATSRMVGNTRVSVHCPSNRTQEGVFAVETAVKCVQIFNEFFGLPYCLPKLDLVGLACLSVGAMENWGLVTFRENSLLVDQATASNAQLQAVATIVAHEVSHQVSLSVIWTQSPFQFLYSPVVWQPSHNALVVRSLAERGLCHIHAILCS